MERSTYYQLAEIENTHWWFVYRRKLMALLIERLGGVSGEAALDVGCGTGGNMGFLKNYCSTVTGIDLSVDALALARKKHPQDIFLRGDVNELGKLYPPSSFDLVSAFTVLCHNWVTSDQQSIHDVFRVLRPGGAFVLTETAFPILRRAHDRLVHAVRRYTLGQLKAMLTEAGFRDVQGTYFNLPAFPVVLLLALIDRLGLSAKEHDKGVAELTPPPKWLNDVAGGVLGVELAAIRAFGRVPFGVSVACVARKPLA
jgi:SAM-dependent methyltransferase